jgi:hypothetical protein
MVWHFLRDFKGLREVSNIDLRRRRSFAFSGDDRRARLGAETLSSQFLPSVGVDLMQG